MLLTFVLFFETRPLPPCTASLLTLWIYVPHTRLLSLFELGSYCVAQMCCFLCSLGWRWTCNNHTVQPPKCPGYREASPVLGCAIIFFLFMNFPIVFWHRGDFPFLQRVYCPLHSVHCSIVVSSSRSLVLGTVCHITCIGFCLMSRISFLCPLLWRPVAKTLTYAS